jgi:hypothetical protein
MATTTLQPTRKSTRKQTLTKARQNAIAATFKKLVEDSCELVMSGKFTDKKIARIGKDHPATIAAIYAVALARYIAKNADLSGYPGGFKNLASDVILAADHFQSKPSPVIFKDIMTNFRTLCCSVAPGSWSEFAFQVFPVETVIPESAQ